MVPGFMALSAPRNTDGVRHVPSGPPPQTSDGPIVLLVDDEPDILESVGDLISAGIPGVRVRAVPSGEAGLEILRRERVDLIIADYKMPGMNGVEFLCESRRIAPRTPSILFTAYPDLFVAIQAINDAAIEYFLTKPFAPSTVLNVVRDVLGLKLPGPPAVSAGTDSWASA